ncbi:hypothetical protein [Rhodococcus sp. ACPA1]|uniref:hypothetical protein n=1 Tax=Rhodococcus sp. ACPA1 TaxID=2028572 RepID=UPI00117A8503|nr:hypothetical protein [Rhodococcus sp. ACPA1]
MIQRRSPPEDQTDGPSRYALTSPRREMPPATRDTSVDIQTTLMFGLCRSHHAQQPIPGAVLADHFPRDLTDAASAHHRGRRLA